MSFFMVSSLGPPGRSPRSAGREPGPTGNSATVGGNPVIRTGSRPGPETPALHVSPVVARAPERLDDPAQPPERVELSVPEVLLDGGVHRPEQVRQAAVAT